MNNKNLLKRYIMAVVIFTFIYSCSRLTLDAQSGTPAATSTAAPAATPKPIDLSKTWSKFLREVTKNARLQGESHFTAILFDEHLEPIHANRYTAICGELIYVGVIKGENETSHYHSIDLNPCSLESTAPSLFVEQINPVAEPETGEVNETIGSLDHGNLEKFQPVQCFNQHVNITVKKNIIGSDGTEKVVAQGHFSLEQYKKYRGTLQMGILYSNLNNETYGIKKIEDTNYIYSKGPLGRSPQYTLSVIIYGIPHYIGSLFSSKHLYSGRDILHERSFFDRIGAVVGAGIKNPMNRFVAGFSFEVIYGVNVMGVWEFAKINDLEGLKIGDPFTGTEADIPLSNRWKSKFVMGISFDFRYISHILSTDSK